MHKRPVPGVLTGQALQQPPGDQSDELTKHDCLTGLSHRTRDNTERTWSLSLSSTKGTGRSSVALTIYVIGSGFANLTARVDRSPPADQLTSLSLTCEEVEKEKIKRLALLGGCIHHQKPLEITDKRTHTRTHTVILHQRHPLS
ncbi:hypothetical protein RRG08_015533 [Elysia crispata]|uniref:Uncharacterized protein n=1 Tax=Elysia crispata TaxID=231223 RepID=A0AAE0YJ30_9GAST|nr:hypothetical protein RRG08_015533 [Elysia crispata]